MHSLVELKIRSETQLFRHSWTISQHAPLVLFREKKKIFAKYFWDVLFLTQEKSADLHSACRVPYHSKRRSAGNTQILSKTWISITARSFFHWSPFARRFVYNMPKVKFMDSSNHTGHFKNNCIISRTHKTRLHFSSLYFKWNMSVTGYNQRTVSFPQRKLPRSTAFSSVIVCACIRMPRRIPYSWPEAESHDGDIIKQCIGFQ